MCVGSISFAVKQPLVRSAGRRSRPESPSHAQTPTSASMSCCVLSTCRRCCFLACLTPCVWVSVSCYAIGRVGFGGRPPCWPGVWLSVLAERGLCLLLVVDRLRCRVGVCGVGGSVWLLRVWDGSSEGSDFVRFVCLPVLLDGSAGECADFLRDHPVCGDRQRVGALASLCGDDEWFVCLCFRLFADFLGDVIEHQP